VSAVRLTTVLAVLVSLAFAGPAAADVYDDFRDDGQIDPCQYTDGQLEEGLNGLPPDVLQYSPGLADQLAAGREGCGGGAPGTSTDTRQFEAVPAPGAAGGGGSGGAGSLGEARIPEPPAPSAAARKRLAEITAPPVSATTRSDVPGWVVALLVAAGLAGILFALARTTGLGADRILRPLRASFAEARGRTADAATQLFDSLRLGR
jgi:hypothetical protein